MFNKAPFGVLFMFSVNCFRKSQDRQLVVNGLSAASSLSEDIFSKTGDQKGAAVNVDG